MSVGRPHACASRQAWRDQVVGKGKMKEAKREVQRREEEDGEEEADT